MRQTACLVLAVLLLAALPVGRAFAEGEQWLRYRNSRSPERLLGTSSRRALTVETSAPEGITVPKLAGSEPLYVKWVTPMVEAGDVWLILDQSRPSGSYDLLYVDSDADGDLAEETPTKAVGRNSRSSQFNLVKMLFPGEDGPVSYHFNLMCYSYRSGRTTRRYVYVTSAGWYEGHVTVADKKYRCRLVDYNANGAFNDTSMNFAMIDRIMIGVGNNLQERFVGKYLQIGDALYTPEVSRDGAFIKLAPAEDLAMGTITFGEEVTSLSLGGENGLLSFKGGGQTELPVGNYRLYKWTIQRTDAKSVKWTLTGSSFPNKSVLAVASGNRTELDVGEPLETSVTTSKRGNTWSFQQNMKGRLGEALSILRNKQRPPAPKLRITNADGSYNRVFSFEYG